MWTTAYVTRNHAYMIYDTLDPVRPASSSASGAPADGRRPRRRECEQTWKLTLRDGLLFHNGERVLASDCAAASIKRWGARDAFGQAFMARTDELSAPDDKTIVFRLKQPFALLPDALGHGASNMCAMMPKYIAHWRSVQAVHRGYRYWPIPLQDG